MPTSPTPSATPARLDLLSRWHRRAGWVVTACGIASAASGLWMQATYQLPEDDGALLAAFRVVFGSGMLVSLVLGAVAAAQRDFARHGAWMLRGYAIGMGAGTQVLTHAPWVLVIGAPDVLTRALLMGAGWVINLAVAECIIAKARDPDLYALRVSDSSRSAIHRYVRGHRRAGAANREPPHDIGHPSIVERVGRVLLRVIVRVPKSRGVGDHDGRVAVDRERPVIGPADARDDHRSDDALGAPTITIASDDPRSSTSTLDTAIPESSYV